MTLSFRKSYLSCLTMPCHVLPSCPALLCIALLCSVQPSPPQLSFASHCPLLSTSLYLPYTVHPILRQALSYYLLCLICHLTLPYPALCQVPSPASSYSFLTCQSLSQSVPTLSCCCLCIFYLPSSVVPFALSHLVTSEQG